MVDIPIAGWFYSMENPTRKWMITGGTPILDILEHHKMEKNMVNLSIHYIFREIFVPLIQEILTQKHLHFSRFRFEVLGDIAKGVLRTLPRGNVCAPERFDQRHSAVAEAEGSSGQWNNRFFWIFGCSMK